MPPVHCSGCATALLSFTLSLLWPAWIDTYLACKPCKRSRRHRSKAGSWLFRFDQGCLNPFSRNIAIGWLQLRLACRLTLSLTTWHPKFSDLVRWREQAGSICHFKLRRLRTWTRTKRQPIEFEYMAGPCPCSMTLPRIFSSWIKGWLAVPVNLKLLNMDRINFHWRRVGLPCVYHLGLPCRAKRNVQEVCKFLRVTNHTRLLRHTRSDLLMGSSQQKIRALTNNAS
jgi:hypothetical protein